MTQTNINKIQTTRKRMIVAIACIGAILLAVNAAVSIWRYQATPWFSMDYAYTRVASFHAMAISIGVLVALMIQLLNSKGKEWFAIPAYAALLCFGTYIAVFGIDGRYLGGRVTYFTPAMMYAALFVSSYAATKDFGKYGISAPRFCLSLHSPLS